PLATKPLPVGEREAALALPDKPSIVVLPFANLSGDPNQDYFADGMVEDITIALGHLPWLFVIGSASAFTYKNRAADLKQLGSELGVRYVLMGSVRKEGNRVRITAQLTDAVHGGHIWADRFEGELDSVFAMQDRVALHVSTTIAPALRTEEIERAGRKPTANLTAYDLFLRALPLYRRSLVQNREAVRLLYRAMELDPSYGAAYGLAALCRHWQRVSGWISPTDPAVGEGIRVAHLAAETGSNDSESLWMAALALTMLAGEFEVTIGLIEKAVSLNPNSSNAWAVSGLIHGLVGDVETSLDHLARARRLNPLEFPFLSYWAVVAHVHFVAGQFEQAESAADRSVAGQAGSPPALRIKIAACGVLGRVKEGRRCVAQLLAITPEATVASLKAHYEPFLRRVPGRFEDFLQGLHRSGLPEK
ncbi:MAG TPA: CadC-family transcriptional regulator, partial [Candidatus Limnocylindria bacterium]|nr:CadC-family transcriptional regulator [Candidatus Limnocylindria bacterium]